MSRISSFGGNQSLLQGLLDNQARMFATQEQVNTGKKSQTYGGLGGNLTALLDAKTLQQRGQSYGQIMTRVSGQLDMNDAQLNGMLGQLGDLKSAITSAIGQQRATALKEQLESSFGFLVNALNTQIGGLHIFAGSKTDVTPINVKTLAELQALPSASDAFDNDSNAPEAIVSEGTKMPYGLLASDMALAVFEVFKEIADYDAGPSGPLDGILDDTKLTFLKGELQKLSGAIDNVVGEQVKNGLRQKRLETLQSQQQEQDNFFTGFISNIEDVNMAEAITQLQQNQVTLQASYNVIAQMSKLSLANFLG